MKEGIKKGFGFAVGYTLAMVALKMFADWGNSKISKPETDTETEASN